MFVKIMSTKTNESLGSFDIMKTSLSEKIPDRNARRIFNALQHGYCVRVVFEDGMCYYDARPSLGSSFDVRTMAEIEMNRFCHERNVFSEIVDFRII